MESTPVPRRTSPRERIPSAATESRRAGLGREGWEARPRGIPNRRGLRPSAVATLGLEEGLSDALGKRGPGSPTGRRRGAFLPWSEALEARRLLATIDLSATPGTLTTKGLGVVFTGAASNTYAGYRVTDVGNVTGSGYDSFVVSAPGLAPPGIGGLANFGAGGESRLTWSSARSRSTSTPCPTG